MHHATATNFQPSKPTAQVPSRLSPRVKIVDYQNQTDRDSRQVDLSIFQGLSSLGYLFYCRVGKKDCAEQVSHRRLDRLDGDLHFILRVWDRMSGKCIFYGKLHGERQVRQDQ